MRAALRHEPPLLPDKEYVDCVIAKYSGRPGELLSILEEIQ
jgi:hypothetical protein